MLKDKLFNNKISKSIFLIELVVVFIFSFFTLYFIDIGSISRNIISKFANEHNTNESLKYLTEWFVISFGGIIGTAVIYYMILDYIIILNTIIFKDIIKLKNKLVKDS
ncbi:hypothetical protein [Staphylococcus shinii]|uniref:hypothetical protein n=1 Tax=Staphylococcus shinii TaxID=2912228 RepID=UPI003F874339